MRVTTLNYDTIRHGNGHGVVCYDTKIISKIYFVMSEIGYICSYCKWVLKKDQITMHSCLNIDNKEEQILVIDSQNRHISIQDIENYELDDIENYTERNEVAKEMSNNDSYSINKQAIDEDLINAVQKRPALYDYRMPLKERSRQKNDLWKKVSKDLNGIYTPIEAEKRWNYLKDRYRKSLNSYKKIQESTQRSGAAGIPKNQLIKPSFKHHHLMSFLNDVFQHRASISSIRMIDEPSTSKAIENEDSLNELVNDPNEKNNESEFIPSSVSSGLSYRSTPSLERKKRKTVGNYDEYDKMFLEALKTPVQPNPIDCFMLRLAEGMRKLPYKERSKLELEFFARLHEIEEQLRVTDQN